MTAKIADCALKLWRVLGETGTLNLWEARAIIGQPREVTATALAWLASQRMIVYRPTENQMFVSLAEAHAPSTRNGLEMTAAAL